MKRATSVRAPRAGVVVGTALFAALFAAGARADVLADNALKAVTEARYCEARDLYVALHEKDAQPKYLYNAAESAYAADDRVAALSLYQELLVAAPQFERAKNAKKRVAELGKIIARDGVGQPCPARVPRCSDAIVDAGEQCDDGNFVDGDGCDAGCRATACGNGVLAPPEQCDDGNVIDGDGCSAACALVAVAPPPPPPPPPPPAERPLPVGAIAVTSTGAVLTVAGAVVGVLGALPWLAMGSENERLLEIRGDFADAEPAVQAQLLDESLAVRDRAEAARASWNEGGQYLWIGGVTAFALGVGATAAGVSWWVLAE